MQNTSLKEITDTINKTGVTRVKLSEDDIRMVVNTLIADRRCDSINVCQPQ
jgi:tRNA G46 methylase TrmB